MVHFPDAYTIGAAFHSRFGKAFSRGVGQRWVASMREHRNGYKKAVIPFCRAFSEEADCRYGDIAIRNRRANAMRASSALRKPSTDCVKHEIGSAVAAGGTEKPSPMKTLQRQSARLAGTPGRIGSAPSAAEKGVLRQAVYLHRESMKSYPGAAGGFRTDRRRVSSHFSFISAWQLPHGHFGRP